MKKKLIIIFTFLTVIYIIVGGLLFLNVTLMESPEVLIEIEVTKVDSEKAILHTVLNIVNPNSFGMVAKNLKIVITSSDGYEVAHALIDGSDIGSHEKKVFIKDVVVSFDGRSPDLLTTKITGEVGVNILFIKKTIQLNMGVITSIDKLINEISAPNIEVTVDFVDMTTKGINLTAMADVYNPNSFDMYIDDISSDIVNEEGKKIGNLDISGDVLSAKNHVQINGTGKVLFEAFNAKKITININVTAGVKIAGVEKNISFNVLTNIIVPNLEELLLSKDKPTILLMKVDEKFTLKGVFFNVLMEVSNSFKVDLFLKDIVCRIYTSVDGIDNLVGENSEIENISVTIGKTDYSTCTVLVPYSKLFQSGHLVNDITVSVSGKATMGGINQYIYLDIRGCHDLSLFG